MEAAPLAALVTSVVALGGAVAGWLKNRSDHRRGVRTDDREDLDSMTARYERYLERIESRLAEVEDDVVEMRSELASERRRYRVAIEYLRLLTRWISTHMPGATPPVPPEIITDDL